MPQTGEVIGSRYRIDAPIGGGGMATVYRATDLRLGREVAVKVLLANLTQDAGLVERFEREARALAAIGHPAVVSVFDVDAGDPASGREPYFVMELCPDGSLAERLADVGRLPPHEVVALARQIAAGLSALHERGIVHRDVKPHNILLTPSGPKLADFGIAKLTTAGMADSLTVAGTAVGTLAYAAPETFAGEAQTTATDTYGLAAVVYEALTGRRPRPDDSLAAAVEARLVQPEPPSALVPGLGTAFDAPIARAMSIDPSLRPDVAAFARELEEALAAPAGATPVSATTIEDRPTESMPAVTAVGAGTGGPRQPRWLVPVAFLAVVLLAVAIVAMALNSAGLPADSPTPGPTATSGIVAGGTLPPETASPIQTERPPEPTPTPRAGGGDQGGDGQGNLTIRVRAALDDFRTEAATSGEEARNDLLDRADEVEKLLIEDGRNKALQKARELERRVDEFIREGKIRPADADRLRTAAEAIVDAFG
jgi:serine/threonine-protein kinase